jgi:hypothetical protein
MNRPVERSVGMTMLVRLAILAVLAVVASGCGSDDADPAASASTPAAGLSQAIKYEVIGGDAFRDDKITVAPDGTASVQTRSGRRTATLTTAELSSLAEAISSAGLTSLDTAVTEPPIPDGVSYRFTYRGRSVETDTGTLPGELRPLIATFDDLIARYGRS